MCRTRTLLLFPLLAGCAFEAAPDGAPPEPVETASAAIAGGYAARSERAVVGLAITGPGGQLARTCSGALVAPDLVLTAQHCVAETPKRIRCDEARFGAVDDPVRVHVTTSEEMWSGGATWTRGREIILPTGGDSVCGHDLALVALEEPVPEDDVVPLDLRLDRAAEDGEPYSAVGFGNTGGDVKDAGSRRRRDGLRVECVGYRCGDEGQVAGNEWRGDVGACRGDSGGPALDAEGRVLGITSRGPTGCNDPIYGGVMEHREWLAEAAVRLAEEGGHPAPAWAGDVVPSPGELDPRWATCAASPPDSARGTSPLGVGALAAAAFMLVRRRSRILARTCGAAPAVPARMRASRKPQSAPCTTPSDPPDPSHSPPAPR